MKILLYTIAGPLFILAFAAHIYVKIALRPKDPDLDDYYHEFEEQHPAYAGYLKWQKITFAVAALAALLLFLAAVI